MKIRAIITVIVTLVILLIGVMLYFQIVTNINFNQERNAYEKRMELFQLGEEMMQASDYLTNQIRRHVQFGELKYLNNFKTEVEVTQTRERIIEDLISLGISDDAMQALASAKNESDSLVFIEERAMQAVADGDLQKARMLVFGNDYDRSKNIIESYIEEFQTLIFLNAQQELQLSQSRTKQVLLLKNLFIGFFILGVILSIALLYIRLYPLRDLGSGLQKLARSEGNLSERLDVESNDEIGIIAEGFNSMMDNLERIFHEIKQTGLYIASSIQQISASSRELESTVHEQLASTREVDYTARNIAENAGELAITVKNISSDSNNTAEKAEKARNGIQALSRIMERLEKDTTLIHNKLNEFDTHAEDITRMVTTITMVADQTNMLSLNASIEAEKAGKYGRGFSIVAEEIRKLADQAAVSTLDIERVVTSMQSSSKSSVKSMSLFTQEVRKGVEDVVAIVSELEDMISLVKNISSRIDSLNENMQTQADGAKNISEAMGELSHAGNNTAEAIDQSNNAIETILNYSVALQKEFSKFNFDDKK